MKKVFVNLAVPAVAMVGVWYLIKALVWMGVKV